VARRARRRGGREAGGGWGVKGPCSFEGCSGTAEKVGLCGAHYRQQRLGQPLRPIRVVQRDCTFPGCKNPHSCHGLCYGHLSQRQEGRPLAPLRYKHTPNEWVATPDGAIAIILTDRAGAETARTVVDADQFDRVRDLRWWRYGGEDSRSATAYAATTIHGRCILLHRMILGVESDPGIKGDHLNGNGLDNRVSNLRPTAQASNAQNVVRRTRPPEMRNVTLHKPTGGYYVTVRREYCGYFRDLEEAKRVARDARARLLPYANEERHR
jgi:hypothetical protein